MDLGNGLGKIGDFLQNGVEGIANFFSFGSGILGFFFWLLLALGFSMLFTSNHFRKIVRKEMAKGGEEYGEIASTKVLHDSGIFSVLCWLLIIGMILFMSYLFYTAAIGKPLIG